MPLALSVGPAPRARPGRPQLPPGPAVTYRRRRIRRVGGGGVPVAAGRLLCGMVPPCLRQGLLAALSSGTLCLLRIRDGGVHANLN